jgi:outer membrane protein
MKKLCLALLAAAAFAPAVQAQSAGDIVARVRAVNIDPATTAIAGVGDVTINSKVIPEVDFTYFVTSNIAAELILTYPQQHDVLLNGAKIGTLKHLPPTLTAQYHFTNLGPVKPYVGAGVNLTLFSDVNLPAGLEIKKSSVGFALQAGVDFAIDKKLSLNLDVKKVQLRTDLSSGGANLGTIKVDPLLIGVGVGYKF